ncbi:MAG: ATP-dependent helicase [Reyranella sp.]|nr:ATP-dependent helicase [Reyranella sp.]
MNETWWVDPSQLDDDQKAILTESPDSNLLILGPPGSGKTNILMLRANYVRNVGPRQLFLTFTRALAEHLRSGPNVGRGDQLQKSEIQTFMGCARAIIRQHGGTVPEDGDDFEALRTKTIEMLEATIEEHDLGELYDVVFIDEVQDFWARELDAIRKLTKHVNFAGDSRQRIWKHREGLATASSHASETVTLVKHYRIGESICRYADQIMPPKASEAALLDGCNYPERLRPSTVETVSCADLDEAVSKCIAKLKEQLRYITEEPMGIIAVRNEALDRFVELAKQEDELADILVRQKSNEYHAYDDSSRVRVMTIHAAKGSEFRAVHLLEGQLFKTHNRELAFTAVTRAKTEVSIYHTGPLQGHMVTATGTLTTDLKSIF